jgi:hypothetical protein
MSDFPAAHSMDTTWFAIDIAASLDLRQMTLLLYAWINFDLDRLQYRSSFQQKFPPT